MRVSEKLEKDYPLWVRIVFMAQKKKYGQALLPTKLWARVPKLFFALQMFFRFIDRKNSPIEPALRALVMVRISQINHCSFCVDLNTSTLEAHKVPRDKITALPEFETSTIYSEKERSALRYAEKVTRSDQRFDDDTFSALKKHFTDDAIIELTALIAFQNLSSKFNSALDVPAQGFCSLSK